MPRPADVAARTSAAVLSLTDEQIVAVMNSSRRIQKRVLSNCWETVKTAAPDLADTLDELHATEAHEDLSRFEALAKEHRKQLREAVKGRAGKLTASLVVSGAVLGLATAGLGMIGAIGFAAIVSGSVLAVGFLTGGYALGHRIARRSGNWLVADPGAAASIVWDAGIDAAAAAALQDRAGQDGLTPDVLSALSSVWTGAGLDTTQFTTPQNQD